MPNPRWQKWTDIMKAYPFEEKRLAKWEPPYLVQPKYDGVRARIVPVANNKYMIVSSSGEMMFSVPHILQSVNQWNPGVELDGEVYRHGWSFEQIFSVTSRTVNLHPEHQAVSFHLFDVVNEEAMLTRAVQIADMKLPEYFTLAPLIVCDDFDAIMYAYERYVTAGYEGIIVRHKAAPYVKKRSTFVMKWKPKKSDTYKIVGYEEEVSKDGILKGTLGALICESGDGTTFKVGSGFNKDERAGFWDIRETLPGLSVRIEYQHLTPGRKVPRFGVFKELTTD